MAQELELGRPGRKYHVRVGSGPRVDGRRTMNPPYIGVYCTRTVDTYVATPICESTVTVTVPSLVHMHPPERGSGIGFLGIAESACSKKG